jgi:putative glycerol-1-phosphate prenyltransferase
MKKSVLEFIGLAKKEQKKLLAILLDPDKLPLEKVAERMALINKNEVDLLFVGGSLLFTNILDQLIVQIKKHTSIPVILFPGNAMQISNKADGILFLSLLSGRNPDFLIGNQVVAAPILKQTNIEILSTSYLLIESGRETTASYISNTKPIPRDKPEIAMATALAGNMMGHQLVYLDGGSGAQNRVPDSTIQQISKTIDTPIIVGGGIRNKAELEAVYKAGATIVVVGTAFENDKAMINDLRN